MSACRAGRWGTLAVLGMAVAVGACGGDDAPSTTVRVGEIRDAIASVESLLGGPQTYSEVNATETEVNVFVVRDGQDFAYLVADGQVSAPPGSEPYDGPTFTKDQVAFEKDVLAVIVENLPDSPLVAFSVTPNPNGGVDYIATVRGATSELRVLLSADGQVLSTG